MRKLKNKHERPEGLFLSGVAESQNLLRQTNKLALGEQGDMCTGNYQYLINSKSKVIISLAVYI